MQTPEIIQNISTLPLMQRISIIENLLQTVKDDVLKQMETNKADNIRVFYHFFLLKNETTALHSLLNQSPTDEPSVTKGDKTLNPTELFGLWENNPLNLQDIRKQNWKRNLDIK